MTRNLSPHPFQQGMDQTHVSLARIIAGDDEWTSLPREGTTDDLGDVLAVDVKARADVAAIASMAMDSFIIFLLFRSIRI